MIDGMRGWELHEERVKILGYDPKMPRA